MIYKMKHPERAEALFAHAQDTLMTIMSELNLAKELIAFFEIMNKKIEEK